MKKQQPPDKLEYIIDNLHKAILIRDASKKDGEQYTTLPMHLGTRLRPDYKLEFDSKNIDIIKIYFQTETLNGRKYSSQFSQAYQAKITKEYPELKVTTYFSEEQKQDVAELTVPRKKYEKIIN